MPASSVPTTVSSEPPRGRCLDAHFRRQVTFETFGVAMYTPPPPDPPDCPEAAAGAAIAAHRTSAQAPRFAGRRVSRKLLRPLFCLRPTGLADGLAPEERRYRRGVPADSPPRTTCFDALRTVPPFTGPTAEWPGDSAGNEFRGSIAPRQAAGASKRPLH